VQVDSRTELVIAVDITKRLGISAQRVNVLASGPGFPNPLGTLGRSSVSAWSNVERWARESPGMYVPQPLALRHDARDSAATDLAREALALTKMNWNNTQFDGRAPITIRAARQVGSILKYVGPDDPVEPRYANYM